jgi:DNA-binding transcriptional LysR family regulator
MRRLPGEINAKFRRIPCDDVERTMLDLRRLRLLHELHRRGTVSAVADALSYSPSTVSQQLGVLQREAGTRLFEPAGRRVRLTDAALVLVAHAERLLAGVERAEADLAAAANAVVGVVRIGAFQTASLYLALPAMTAVRELHPQVQVELVEIESEPALAALRSHALDLVIAEEYAGDPQPRLPGVDREDVLVESVRLLLPPRYPHAAGGGPVPLTALAGEAWAATHPDGGQEAYLRRVCNARGGFEPDIRHRANDLTILVSLVSAGHALTLMPDLVPAERVADVAVRPIAEAPLSRTVFTAVRTSADRRPALTAVRTALREVARTAAGGPSRGSGAAGVSRAGSPTSASP